MGKYFSHIIDFVRQEDFDIIQLQEVSRQFLVKFDLDSFTELKSKLAMNGELTITFKEKGNPQSYFGNATLYKPHLNVLHKKVIWLNEYKEITVGVDRIEDLPRNALHLRFQTGSTSLNCINAHLAWGPTPDDQPYKLGQAQKLIDYVKKLDQPFLLSGDFNLTPQSAVVQSFEKIAVNLSKKHALTNTLNPRTHKVKKLFPPGLAVDYIFMHPSIKVNEFKVIDDLDLSDHFGLQTTIEV